jgi:hypothetical protein
MVHRWRLAGVLFVCAVFFVGCGVEDDAIPQGSTTETSIPATQTPPTTMPDIVAIVGVYDAVEAYPACGNEPFDHLGMTWYPLFSEGFDPMMGDLQERVDEVRAVQRESSPVRGVHGLVRVPAPGPGDNIGTLVVWADGVARWVSDSRDLDVWLIDEPISYSWVC